MTAARKLPDEDPAEQDGPAALEAAIRRRASAFDAPALIALLREELPGHAIRFRCRPSLSTRSAIVHDVAITPEHVVVTLNLGLRSSTSPLPSYFLEMLAHPRAGPALEGVLALLDDRLLRDRVDALLPERAERLFPRASR
jgi:predicted component of type VI protein secretion system